ncbi:hypothetical protein [Azospirillum sp.]|uniref:hypothetical protein n=1 Tax=Azospirillum sp. TaxID=34012 RepID=UPI003D731E56
MEREDLRDPDAAYAEGYRAGQRDLRRQVETMLKNFLKERELVNSVLADPDALIAYAKKHPEFESAITTAVLVMLMEGADDKANA